MSVVRWGRREALDVRDPLVVDDLDATDVLVIDDVTAADDPALAWCRRAPCVVVATHDSGPPTSEVDVVLCGDEAARWTDPVTLAAEANPSAARTLVDVLRVVERLDVPAGLVVESLAYSMLLAGPEFAAWLAGRSPRSVKSFDAPPVRIERAGDALHVTLSRSANRNAFSAELRDGLVEALAVAEVDPSIEHVVLDADGPVFSAGGDLTEFGSAEDVVRAHQVRTLRSVGAQLARLAPRVTVMLQGACVGAGVELGAFAGRVVADPGTTFRLPEVGMGLIPGAGGTVSLTRRLGRQRTALLALAGDAVGVSDPLVRGLVDEVR